MAYAEFGDIAIPSVTEADESLIGRLIERACAKIDGECAAAGADPAQLSRELLRECCCEMVESVLEEAVGSDYGQSVSYEAAARRMQVPPEYKRMLGIRRQRVGGLTL